MLNLRNDLISESKYWQGQRRKMLDGGLSFCRPLCRNHNVLRCIKLWLPGPQCALARRPSADGRGVNHRERRRVGPITMAVLREWVRAAAAGRVSELRKRPYRCRLVSPFEKGFLSSERRKETWRPSFRNGRAFFLRCCRKNGCSVPEWAATEFRWKIVHLRNELLRRVENLKDALLLPFVLS